MLLALARLWIKAAFVPAVAFIQAIAEYTREVLTDDRPKRGW